MKAVALQDSSASRDSLELPRPLHAVAAICRWWKPLLLSIGSGNGIGDWHGHASEEWAETF